MLKSIANGRHFLLLLLVFYTLINFLFWKQVFRQIRSDEQETIQTTVQHNNNLVVSLEQAAIRTIRDADAALSLVKLVLEKEGTVDFGELVKRGILDLKLFDGLAIIDSNGRLQSIFPQQVTSSQVNLSDRMYFTIHKQFEDTLYISKPVQSRTIHKSVIVISRKITGKDNRFNGVLAIQVQPSVFMRFYRQANIRQYDILSLIAPDGITYSRRTGTRESSGENISKSPLFQYVNEKPVGNYRATDAIRAQPTFFSYRKLNNYPVIATVGSREQDVFARFHQRRNREVVFGLCISLVLLVFFLAVYLAFSQKRKSLQEVRKSETRYRSIFESSRDAILLLHPDGMIEDMNKAARSMFRTSVATGKKTFFPQLFAATDPAATFSFHQPESFGKHNEFVFTGFDGSKFVGELACSRFQDADQQIRTLVLVRDITQRRQLEKQHQFEQKRYQRNLTKQIIIAQEREREIIGHELHDNVNQILTTVKLYLETALKAKDRSDDYISRSINFVQHCIREIRNLSHSLSAPTLGTNSLVDSVKVLIEDLSKCTNITVHFDSQAFLRPIGKEQSVTLYRIAQEQLNNIIKHAAASHIDIILRQTDDQTQLIIADNGKGFNSNDKKKGIGLNNITSRIKAFQGQFFIDTSIGKGCTLTVTLPFMEQQEPTKKVVNKKGLLS